MDENNENKTPETAETPSETMQETTPSQSSGVSFPTIPQNQNKSKKGLIILIISILAILGVLGFFIFKGSTPSATPTPIATVEGSQTEEPTSTPEAVDKSKIVIEIQNGTGISGEATFLQSQLRNLGYTNIKVGNASSQDNTTTTVTFSKSLSSSLADELTEKLEGLYKKVETKTSSTSSTDVLIVTGLRKGATVKPSSTPTPKATASGSPKPSGSATPTGSPTATPTATP